MPELPDAPIRDPLSPSRLVGRAYAERPDSEPTAWAAFTRDVLQDAEALDEYLRTYREQFAGRTAPWSEETLAWDARQAENARLRDEVVRISNDPLATHDEVVEARRAAGLPEFPPGRPADYTLGLGDAAWPGPEQVGVAYRSADPANFTVPHDALPFLDRGFVRLVRTNVDDRRDSFPDEQARPDEWWNAGKGTYGLTDGDLAIVESARVSYGLGTRPVRDDETLIHYLMRHRHSTPFEAPDFTVHIKAPLDTTQQTLRHRTFSYNQRSYRYSLVEEGDFYVPDADRIRQQSTGNRQGGGDQHPHADAWTTLLRDQMARCGLLYRGMVSDGDGNGGVAVARETARLVLPVATYTEFHMKGNLWNWLHFLKLRLDPHAQWEIRQMAGLIHRLIQPYCPIAFAAWEDYHLHAVTISNRAACALAKLLDDAGLLFDAEGDAPGPHGNTSVLELALGEAGLRGRELHETLAALRGKLA